MSKVDWSLAPEGATHYGVVADKKICWYSVKSECRYDYAYQRDGYSAEKWTPSSGEPGHRPLIERPTVKPWSGPEDGLPPIGTVCTFGHTTVTIITYVNQPDSREEEYRKLAVGQKENQGQIVMGNADCFMPIRTNEQVADESRETAIRELMDIAQVDCRVTAARLVDAGFKREVK